MKSGRHKVDVGGTVPDYNYKTESNFLTGQVEYSQSGECVGPCLALEHSMMKSSMLFECRPSPLHPPHVIHMISVPRPSPAFLLLLRFHV